MAAVSSYPAGLQPRSDSDKRLLLYELFEEALEALRRKLVFLDELGISHMGSNVMDGVFSPDGSFSINVHPDGSLVF
jgi:hypothetical protein